mgnify:FL=1
MLPCKIKTEKLHGDLRKQGRLSIMNKHQRTAGTYGLLGSVILLCVGTYRIGKSIYQKSKQNAKLNNDHHDLFV